MLDTTLKTQLQTYLGNLRDPIELIATLDESSTAQEMASLLDEIANLSSKVTVRRTGSSKRTPSFIIAKQGQSRGVEFAAIPLGHEFTSLVLALLWTGGHPPKVAPELLEQVKRLSSTHHFEVFMSLSCHSCPDVVQAAALLCIFNPNISCTILDGALHTAEAQARQVMAVPMVFDGEAMFSAGRMTLEEMLAKLDTGAAASMVTQLNEKAPYDMLVVGGGPAAAAAAVYAARKGIRVGILAQRFGGQVNDTLGIENYPSVPHTTGPVFAASMLEHVKQNNVEVINLQTASHLAPVNTEGAAQGLSVVTLDNGATLKARSLILATGARWRNVNVPGEQEYKNKGVAYCPHCDGPLYKGKRVAVIGGGNSGVEAAIDLAGIVTHVSLIEFDVALKADAVLVNKLKSLANVSIYTHAQTTEITGDGNTVNGIRFTNRSDQSSQHIPLEGVFVQIGLVPNTDWLKGTVNLSRFGEIEVDAKGHTSAVGVFAAGDCTTVPYKQIVIAAGEGAKAALSAFDYLIRQG